MDLFATLDNTNDDLTDIFGGDVSSNNNSVDPESLLNGVPQELSIVPASGTELVLPPREDLEYPKAELQSLVCQANLGCSIDLRELTIKTRIVEYNPHRMSAAIVRWPKPRIGFRVFLNGCILILGCKDWKRAKHYGKALVKLIQRAVNPKVRFVGFKICTCISNFQCGFPVRLQRLADEHREFSQYEPELMSGLVYRFPPNDETATKAPNHTPTIIVFVTGRCIVSGCKDLTRAQEVVDTIYPLLRKFRT